MRFICTDLCVIATDNLDSLSIKLVIMIYSGISSEGREERHAIASRLTVCSSIPVHQPSPTLYPTPHPSKALVRVFFLVPFKHVRT